MTEHWLPDGAVLITRVEVIEYLTVNGELEAATHVWTHDGTQLPTWKHLGMLAQAQLMAGAGVVAAVVEGMEGGR